MKLRHVGISLAALTLAASAAARAQTRDDTFNAWDSNHDGRLEMGEMQQNQANFKAMDCDHDGYLSRDEFVNRYRCDQNNAAAAADAAQAPAVNAAIPRDEFWRLDRNRDGVVTRGEWSADGDTFRRYDRNNDGRVTRDEYMNPMDVNSPEYRFQSEDRNNDGVLTRSEWRGSRAEFERMDRNRNGVLDFNEYTNTTTATPYDNGSWQTRFDTMDRNHDGTLSSWEWRGESTSFRDADVNSDNRVSRDEYARLYGRSSSDNGGYGRDRTADATIDQRFRDLDRNRDGQLTRYEWRNETVPFNTTDRNGDMVVTASEYRDAYYASGTYGDQYRRTSFDPNNQRFNYEDRNHDGRITQAEWRGERGAFDILDRNNDGVISVSEYRDRSALADQFSSWDSNRDGLLDRNEWRYGGPLFERLDVNRDGRVSRDEFLGM